MWASTFNASGQFNNNWFNVPGRTASPPTLAWNPLAGKFQMVVRAADNSMWMASFSPTGQFNNDWVPIPGRTVSPPALAWNPLAGKMQMVVRASDDSIWVASFNSAGSFNNDWTSSLFVSQDQVAVESVCFDFLKAEFTSSNRYGSYPQVAGADDHILQAADSTFWPPTIKYDPEKDGTTIGSLGVCEHWNNAIDKQYTRNLGTGSGIELVFLSKTATVVEETAATDVRTFSLLQNYPNPFNPTTAIRYRVSADCVVRLKVFDALGREVANLVDETQRKGEYSVVWRAGTSPSGTYFYRLVAGEYAATKKMILAK